MSADTTLPADLIQAYRETHYQVATEPPVILRIGQTSAALAELYRQYQVQSAAFITACNPFSEPTSEQRNAQLQQELAEALVNQQCLVIDGVGQHPSNDWPGEPSFLALDLSRDDAKQLGKQFGQNAVVWMGQDTCPELVLLV